MIWIAVAFVAGLLIGLGVGFWACAMAFAEEIDFARHYDKESREVLNL